MSTAPSTRTPWAMLGVAIVLLVASGPGQTVGVSIFVDHFMDDLNLTRSQVSTAYLIGTLCGAVAMPLAGRFIDRRGVRTAALVVVCGFVIMLFGMAAVAGFTTLAIGFAGTRGFGQGSLSLVSTTTVAVWFDQRRGTAVGLLSAVGGAGMALIPILGAVLISVFGWRVTWMLLASLVAVVAIPLAWFVLRDPRPTISPSLRTRQHPVTSVMPMAATSPSHPSHPAPTEPAAEREWTSHEVLRHPAFWVVLLASSTAGMLSTALVFHQIDLLGARGLTATQAAANFLPQTLAAAGGALVTGRLVDRFAPRYLLALALVALAAPNLLWHVVSPGATAIAYGVLIGVAGSSIRTIEASVLPLWYGIRSIGEIRGIVMTSSVAATAIGPIALSLGRDVSGSYGATLLGLTVIPVTLAAVAVVIHPPVTTTVPPHGDPGDVRSAVRTRS